MKCGVMNSAVGLLYVIGMLGFGMERMHAMTYKGVLETLPPNMKFRDFVPNDTDHTCQGDKHTTPFNQQVRGVNLGGWLVLEPWITPSIFYQFLSTQKKYGDQAKDKTGMDQYTFCKALGPEEGNRQLRIHWREWVKEEDIKKLASFGINSVRIPIGDWMFKPYGPYVGCTDGATEELDRVLDLCQKYGLSVLLDIHAQKGSQNGFDNSGQSARLEWTSIASSLPIGQTTFEHWPIREASWVGTFNRSNKTYSEINYDNINHSLDVIRAIVQKYKDHHAILGIEPVNEPWELTPIDLLKQFYWDGYKITKSIAPDWKYVMHDSFRFVKEQWGGFMKGCPDIAMDTHIYQAWMNPGSPADYFSNACQQKYGISTMEENAMPIIVGEWSLAGDNCAMWLNGFNDNLPGFPKVQCKMIDCPASYLPHNSLAVDLSPEEGLPKDQIIPGLPLDATQPLQGPYGTGTSGPSFGQCPVTNHEFLIHLERRQEAQMKNLTGTSINGGFANKFKGLSVEELENQFTAELTLKKLNGWSTGHGWYFWNFKNEMDAKWDFIRAVENGWIPMNVMDQNDKILNACEAEDKGEFVCMAKRGVASSDLEGSYKWACGADPKMDCASINATYPTLLQRCDAAFDKYWHLHRAEGATCDFGGAGTLKMINKPKSPSDAPAANPLALEAESASSSHLVSLGLLAVVGTAMFAGYHRVVVQRKRKAYMALKP